jgi:acetyl-CoA/propionyl-CoA carboxylase biotin carboxyl carrier protein
LADPDVVAGRLDTELVDRELPRLLAGHPGEQSLPDRLLAVHGLVHLLALQPDRRAAGSPGSGQLGSGQLSSGSPGSGQLSHGSLGSGRDGAGAGAVGGRVVDPWQIPSGWRMGEHRPLLLRADLGAGAPAPEGLDQGNGVAEIRVWGTPDAARVQVGAGPVWQASVRTANAPRAGSDGEVLVTLDGVTRRWLHAIETDRTWLTCDGRTWVVARAVIRLRERAVSDGAAEVRSPMPGVVLAIQVAEGDEVSAGQPLIVVEAMKMEHSVTAARAGRVGDLLVRVGDQVALDQPLAFIHSADADRELRSAV